LFHVERGYLDLFQRYFRALQNRNELLRRHLGSEEARYWTEEFLSLGEAIDELRRKCVVGLNASLARISEESALGTVSLSYISGWKAGSNLAEALADTRVREVSMGTTLVGPHRATLKILLNGIPARQTTSRGQSKLIACLIAEAQMRALETEGGEPPLLLIDDLSAELDQKARERALALLLKQRRQVFITAINASDLGFPPSFLDVTTFHVKQGVFSAA
jgi:DNA replication and repair protein RecF